jgi:hypothetical protein
LKLRWRVFLLIGGLAVLTCVLYFVDYHPGSGNTDTPLTVDRSMRILSYVCAYLAIPFSRLNHFLGAGIGLVALIGVACAVVQSFRSVDFPGVARLATGVMVFITGGALLTALGRASVGPPEAALRYATPASVFWVCALLILLTWRRIRTSPVLAVAVTASILAIIPAHLQETDRFTQMGAAVREAALAVTADVPARDEIKVVYPDPNFVFPLFEVLRAHRLSVFSGTVVAMREPLESHYRLVGGDRCQGFWDVAAKLDSPDDLAESATGWAWDNAANRPPQIVVIADQAGIIRGLARFTLQRDDVARAMRNNRMTSSGWFGFVRRRPAGGTYHAYALLSDSVSLCAVHDPVALP